MATTNYNLPTISGASPVAIVDDYNALANATDAALAGAISGEKTRAMAAETELANGVSNALTTANSANVSATDAKSAADKAQTTASNALTNAATAQTTADGAQTLATKAESNAEAMQQELANLLNFTVAAAVSNTNAALTGAINASKTLFKLYGWVRVTPGQTLNLSSIPGGSGNQAYGLKIDFGGKLNAGTEPYAIVTGGLGNWDSQNSFFATMSQSSFVIGTDGNAYALPMSSSSVTVSASDQVLYQQFPACLYANANFGDSPISPEPPVSLA